jgi:hypothetical protein
VTDDEVRRARARAQLLDGGADEVSGAVRAVVGIQAQDERAAALSIRARTVGVVADDVDRAVRDERSVVLTWSLRGTRHYHHGEDVRWLLGLLGPVFGRPGRRAEQLGIAGPVGNRAVAAVGDAVAADGPLTRAELAERLTRHGVDPTGQAPIHVIRRAALEGLICVVPQPPAKDKERYALLDEWVPAGRGGAAPTDPGAELARRYLAAFGPSTCADFTAWSGLGARAARDAWSAIAEETDDVGTGRAGPLAVLAGDRPRPLDQAVPLRLVGGFDTLLLGYADRTLHLGAEHARRVNAGGGIVHPTVIADGRVIGTWAYRRTGRRHAVDVAPFRGLTGDERRQVEREAADVGRFLGSDPALTVTGR